uniref:NADH dehydrogenase [ubiquinone] 1 alpha subcomplex subunit 1 n=1 Tax=Glossina brevipalpis TaxID=37001 RepID=A0A1A9X3J5_9MUSC
MWFEILPSAAIITVALAIPIHATYGIHKLVLGNPYRRNMDERFDRVLYLRDRRLNNDPYIQNGLEKIPDKADDED